MSSKKPTPTEKFYALNAGELRAWRKLNNFTQEQAAEFVGYSLRHYQRFEEEDAEIPYRLSRFVAVADVKPRK